MNSYCHVSRVTLMCFGCWQGWKESAGHVYWPLAKN